MWRWSVHRSLTVKWGWGSQHMSSLLVHGDHNFQSAVNPTLDNPFTVDFNQQA